MRRHWAWPRYMINENFLVDFDGSYIFFYGEEKILLSTPI